MNTTSKVVRHLDGPLETREHKNAIFVVQPHPFIEAGLYAGEVSLQAWGPPESNIPEQRRANARMFAASTQMLAELKEALLLAEHQLPCDGHIGDNPCICGYQNWWDRCNTLIAKVEGR